MNEAGLVGEDNGLRTVTEPKLHQDAAYVGLDGLFRDDKVAGYFSVRHATGNQGEHFGLPFGQAFEVLTAGAPGCAHPGELGDETPGDARGEQCVTRRYQPHRVSKLAGGCVLEQETAGA